MKKLTTSYCANCGTQHHHALHYPFKYCDNACQHIHKIREINWSIAEGNTHSHLHIKRFLIQRDGHQCVGCNQADHRGQPIPLELEHKDGNSSRNVLENCELLCPNCHAQTLTYKNRNKGNGRAARRQRYQDGKSY